MTLEPAKVKKPKKAKQACGYVQLDGRYTIADLKEIIKQMRKLEEMAEEMLTEMTERKVQPTFVDSTETKQ